MSIMNSMAVRTEHFHNVCRLCLGEDSLEDVFQEEDLHQWISDLLSLTITTEDQLSRLICAICRIRLIEFQQFRLRVQDVQSLLQSRIQSEHIEQRMQKKMHGPKKKACTRCGKSVAKRHHSKRQRQSRSKEIDDQDKTNSSVGINSTCETPEQEALLKSSAEEEMYEKNSDHGDNERQELPLGLESDISNMLHESEQDHGEKSPQRSYQGKDDGEHGNEDLEDMIEIEEMQVEPRTDDKNVESLDGKSYRVLSEIEVNWANTKSMNYQEKTIENKSLRKIENEKDAHERNSDAEWKTRTDNTDNEYSCSKCDRSFHRKCQLTSHLKTHDAKAKENHSDEYEEDDSISSRPQSPALDQSLPANGESNNNDRKQWRCDKCPKSFSRKNNLKKHIKYHGPRKFICPICGKPFFSSSHVQRHIPIHDAVRKRPGHKCRMCDFKCSMRKDFKRHVRRHYNSSGYPVGRYDGRNQR